MNTRLPLIAFWILAPALAGSAAPLRITTCDLRQIGSGGDPVRDAVAFVKQLPPDVLILQHAADWQTCHELADALRPDTYKVAICSSFAGPRADGQVAILSRTKADLAWSEPWANGGGGMAFAEIRLMGKKFGVFSVQTADDPSWTSNLKRQLDSLQAWQSNRLDAFVVAGDFKENPHELQQAGFATSFAGSAESILTRDAALVTPGPITQTPLRIATCQIDPAVAAAAPVVSVAPVVQPIPKPRTQPPWWIAALLAAGIAIFVWIRKAGRRAGLQPAGAVAAPAQRLPVVHVETEGTVLTESQTWRPELQPVRAAPLLPDVVREGVIANLSRWLKHKVIQRLLSDRARLLASEEAAALKVLSVDQRLTKVEQQIQHSQREYEQRIDDLVKELSAAKEENRELIRARITLLKAEMERARLRASKQESDFLG